MPRRLAIFPLGTVLLPHGLLPLHIFEERYRVLMADLLGDPPEAKPDAEMGIVLIERGHEVGGGDVRSPLGTIARIVRADLYPDGRWGVVAVGSRRFRVVDWLPDDPYPLADVEELPEEVWGDASDERMRDTEKDVRRAIALASELGASVTQPELSPEPAVASWQLCQAIPVGPYDRQRLLSADGFDERLEMLADLAREVASMLELRLNHG